MSLDGIFQGVAAFLTSSQQARSDAIHKDCAQHAYWLRKRKTVRVSSPAPKKPARKDSAACVSLSSYHNVKEPVGGQRMPPPEPPMEANPPLGVNDRRSVNPSLNSGLAPLLSEDRAVAYNPAGRRNDPREGFI
jgi:hypothetical protein